MWTKETCAKGVERVSAVLSDIDSKKKKKPITVIFIKGKEGKERRESFLEIVDCLNRRRYDTLTFDTAWDHITHSTDIAKIEDVDKMNIPINDFFDLILGPRLRATDGLTWNKYNYVIMTSEKEFDNMYKDATGYHRFILMDIKVKLIEVDI